MSIRFIVGLFGIVTLALGIAGLANPRWVMDFVGYSTASVSPLILGEVRGVYGGMFSVMGVFTLLGAVNPVANRRALLVIGLLWLGICAGRLLAIYFDGDPGVSGWIGAGFEFLFGLVPLLASLTAKSKLERKPVEPTIPLVFGPTEL